MIEIKNLNKSYGSLNIYNNFNLNIDCGGVTCILGESGSGKTTLLNCIAGLVPYQGEITKVKFSYIFQTPRLVPNLTVLENLRLVCKDNQKIFSVAERLKIKDKINEYPINLSGGQAQRVAIARAVVFDSDVILMDEPFSSLDLKLKAEICKLFCDILHERGGTAVYVTHDVDEAVSIANRILVINNGKTVCDFKPQTAAPRAMGGDENLRKRLISALMD